MYDHVMYDLRDTIHMVHCARFDYQIIIYIYNPKKMSEDISRMVVLVVPCCFPRNFILFRGLQLFVLWGVI